MESEPHRRVETVFHAALERRAGAERMAYLDGACGDDGDLRSRVDALLGAHEEATGFLEVPPVEGSREGPGTSIGDYKLLQEIGEGGMGVVYMAEQQEPVRRKVAVKVIKLGMDTKQVIARFEAERQALAMMDHANIARVLDAGSTEAGRPYFVMELVRGVPIDEYCDTHNLPTDERLALFTDVCRAVQHAHQKGVIHRDLKPTNVLVTSHDGRPVPKIIDFGVAKATNQNLTERTLFTEFRQIIGTPEYMSPEQAEMSGLDVDTRSDIYTLGVLLYRLLTGTTPVDPRDLRTAGFEEMTRIIREDDPPAPSTRISKLGASAEKIARSRSSDAGSLSRHLRGDLDWIVMKALEKDRTRRYETASALAADIVRHLENRPVEAGPPGTTYRLRKFARRNRKAVVAALALLAVLGLGLAGTTAGFLRARAEARHSRAMSDSLQDVLAMTDSTRVSEQREVEAVLETVREVFGEEHATYAAVLDTLAQRLHDAGDFAVATDLARESLEVWERVYGEDHPNVAIAFGRLGTLLRAVGEEEGAEAALRRAIDLLEGASDAPGLAGYEARMELADLLGGRGDFAEADELLADSLAQLRASPSPSRFQILKTLERRLLAQLSHTSPEAGKTLRALYEESHAFYPEDSPVIAVYALSLGNYLIQRGDLEAAEPYLRETIEIFGECEEPARLYSLGAYERLFQVLRGRTDPDSVAEADLALRGAIDSARDIWSVDTLVQNLDLYAERVLRRRRFGEAIDALVEVNQLVVDAGYTVEERRKYRHGLVRITLHALVYPDLEPEVYVRARAAVERALQDEPDNPAILAVLAAALYRQGELTRAAETLDLLQEPLARSSQPLARRLAPTDHVFGAMVHARLGDDARARTHLEALRSAIEGQSLDEHELRVLAEVEALLEQTSSGADE